VGSHHRGAPGCLVPGVALPRQGPRAPGKEWPWLSLRSKGSGAGIIYIATVANAVKWFPDRRGLAAGLTAAGFGGGAALMPQPEGGAAVATATTTAAV
jgi:hypothetical protein